MPGILYRPSVRVGNWYEDISLQEDEIKKFLNKRQNNELLLQKARTLLQNLHKNVIVASVSDFVHFGSVIQLVPCKMRICEKPSYRPALSVVGTEKSLRTSMNINEDCELTVSMTKDTCVRNTFKIVSADNYTCRKGENLKYNQDFCLQCTDPSLDGRMLLYGSQKSNNLNNMVATDFNTYAKGEINLPLGLIYRRNTGAGHTVPSYYTRWNCKHQHPNMRFRAEGEPVPSHMPLIISHTATNRNLAAEDKKINTLFGIEALASITSYKNPRNIEEWQNLWMFVLGYREDVSEKSKD